MRFTFRRSMALMMMMMMGIMFFTANQASARIVTYDGPCVLGGNWSMVITINDNTGEVTRREGTNCNGEIWVDHCMVSIGSNLGSTSEYYIQDVSITPHWWIRFNTDHAGNITSMWGKDADGNHWIASVGTGSNHELE